MRARHEIARIAARQHGVVTVAQLHAFSFDDKTVARLVASSSLHRLHRGVYAVGHTALTQHGIWLAAVLACGGDAGLSHVSAAELQRLLDRRPGPIHVTSPHARGRNEPGIVAHRSPPTEEDVTLRHGIRVTTPARTLLDLAEVVSARQLAVAVDRALARGTHREIDQQLSRAHGRRGARLLRAALHRAAPDAHRTRSELEMRFLRLLDEHGFPRPLVNVSVYGYEVDLYWPDFGLVVELDGFEHHRGRAAFEQDRRRTADLTAAGLRVLRFTWRQVTEDPEWVLDRLALT